MQGNSEEDRNVKVLLIEDNPGYAELMGVVLTKVRGDQFDLECVSRLSGGLELLGKGGVDVVLLDLSLPDSKGLDTFFTVFDKAPEVPVIVLTATDDEALAVKAVQAGAQDYLVKGQVDRNLLVRSIHYAIERHRIQEELRRQTAIKLQSSEARFLNILESNADGIVIVDKKEIVLYVNPAAEAMFGRKAEELLGESFGYPVVAGETTELEIVRGGGGAVAAEMRVVETEWEGEVVYLASLRDITERKRMEGAVREANIFLRSILDSSSFISIISTDLEHNILYWNKGAENIFGYKAEEVVGRHKIDILYPDDEEDTKEKIEGVRSFILNNKEGISCEIREMTKDGRKLWINLTSSPRFDENGQLRGILGIGEDISERKRAEGELRQSSEKLQRALDGIVRAIALTTEIRDPYTAGHQQRVANLARAIAEEMGLSKEQIRGIHTAAVIHDIGKIYIPAEILSKPGQLTEIEVSLFRAHPQIGYDILKTIEFPWPVAQIVLQHHERMDGSGYPKGLSGEDILLEARILGVADIIEAMASHRPYRPAFGIDKALEEISQNRGTPYDPEVVSACLRLFKEKGFTFE
ncbi:MAG: PAS domain S-box protein [Deltaproteobacteria bacterium]|nr:PAS domain S-box protein [Deltaproteobacteria bacterium]